MPHTLLLRLPTAGQEDTEWLSIDDKGVAEATRQRGPLSLAAAVARTAKVIVLAPATHNSSGGAGIASRPAAPSWRAPCPSPSRSS